jgi:hypothetical protein
MTDAILQPPCEPQAEPALKKVKLGFVGVGWIGRSRLQALAGSGLAEIAAVTDPDEAGLEASRKIAPDVRAVDGSFYDFFARLHNGTKSASLAEPPDAWSGRAAVEWARKLQSNSRFDGEAKEHIAVAQTLDSIYGREGCRGGIHNVEIIESHDRPRKWAEERGGKPAAVKRTREPGEETGILRMVRRDEQ